MTPVHLPLTPAWLLWAHPWVLAGLLVVPGYLLWAWRRRGPAIRYSDTSVLRGLGGSLWSRARGVLPLLRAAALAALIIAVARPQRPDESSYTFAEGIAILMVVDTSSSMTDDDLSPPRQSLNRLDVVKDVFRKFVMGGEGGLAGRSNDLIGMIRFARYADSVCPLTLDRTHLLEVLKNTDTVRNREEDGTAIGDGLALAVERLRDVQRATASGQQLKITSRVVILLTDGENNAGNIAPQQAGELAATYGIRVYTILAGTGQNRMVTRVPVDTTDMRRIADVTGGRFFQARDANALIQIYEQIDQLERTHVEEKRFVRYGELSWPLLIAAFALTCAQTLLDSTILRKIP
ncbi:MAG: VWA domain-containing protein [Phycisphaerales bacterium]|nr:VWA domain-containing protein [Phycisphaerales bacterium]